VFRQIGGWLLAAVGILLILVGAAAIAGSYDPSTQDPDSTRLGAAIFIGFGLVLAVPGILLIRSGRRIARATPKRPRPERRFTKVHLVGYAAAALLAAAFGVGAIVYSFSLDGEVQSFRTSHQCSTAPGANCYQLRNVVIAGVDISHGRSGEADTVRFTDSGTPHEVAIHPGGLDSSVLRTGAEGVATVWHEKYTNLDVSGVSFATLDNPVGQRGEWREIGIIVLGTVLLQMALLGGGLLYVRRRTASRSLGGVPGTPDLLPPLGVGAAGYPILPLVLHPSAPKGRLLVWLVAVPIGLVGLYFYLAQYGPIARWTAGLASALLFVAGAFWQFVLLPRSAIYVDEVDFGTINGLGRRKSWVRGEAARVVLRTLDRPRTSALPIAFVVARDGRALMKFSALLYPIEALTQFATGLRVPLDTDSLDTPITPVQLEKEIPGSLSWPARHPTALGAGIVIVAIAVILLFVGLGSGPSHR
jgi:hypothetical protein